MSFVNRTSRVLKNKVESLYLNWRDRLRGGVFIMYAVLLTGGKQYRVQEGDVIYVEKLNAEVDSTIELTEVLAVSNGETLTVGRQ